MNAKSVITGILILFVAVSVVYLFVRNESAPDANKGVPSEEAAVNTSLPHQVIAYYFHGDKRCKTCLKIEELAKSTVETAYPDELADGRLVWKVVNFEEAGNEHFADDYELVASSLVIVDMKDGVQVAWKNLDQVWDLVWEDDQFIEYVKTEVGNYLGEK